MPSRVLNISDIKDLQKLKGWVIEEAKMTAERGLVMTLSHIAAENRVYLIINPTIAMGLSGNVVIANKGLVVGSEDVIGEVLHG